MNFRAAISNEDLPIFGQKQFIFNLYYKIETKKIVDVAHAYLDSFYLVKRLFYKVNLLFIQIDIFLRPIYVSRCNFS